MHLKLSFSLATACVAMPVAAQISSQESVRESIEQAQARIQELQSRPLARVRGADDLPPPPARLPIYFSPEAPALAAAIDRVAPLYAVTWSAPAELAAFVNEPFYAPLGTHLAEGNLSGRQRRRLDVFREHREAALQQLRDGIFGATVAAGKRSLAVGIEQEAEELRKILCTEESSWSRFRNFRGTSSAGEQAAALLQWRQFQLLRAAVYYQAGLSPAQRRLLLELSQELLSGGLAAELPVPRAAAGAMVYFLPESARIPVPSGLPLPVAVEFDEFLAEKHRLKLQIAAEIIRQDGAFDSKRERALSDLARRQAAGISALEEKAESIRRALAALPAPGKTQLPKSVLTMAADYRVRRRDLQGKLILRLQAVRREFLTYSPGYEAMRWESPVPANTYVVAESPDAIVSAPAWLTETPQQLLRPKTAEAKLKEATGRFAHDTAQENSALEARRFALLMATARALNLVSSTDDALTLEITQHVLTKLRNSEEQNRMAQFADYETAALRPGLAPADRRLLFNHALLTLSLPLPAAVRRPVGRFE